MSYVLIFIFKNRGCTKLLTVFLEETLVNAIYYFMFVNNAIEFQRS